MLHEEACKGRKDYVVKIVALTVVLGVPLPSMPVMPLRKIVLVKPILTLHLKLPTSSILLVAPLPKLQAASPAEEAPQPKEVESAKPVKKAKAKVKKASRQEEDSDEDWEKWLDELFDGRDPREGEQILPEDELIRDIGVPRD